jgi:hypothetical protein
MANPKIVDLDSELDSGEDEVLHTKKIKLLDKEWTIVCDLNTFAMAQIASGDAGGIATFIAGLVIEDERDEFVKTLAGARHLTGERLGAILNRLIEVAGERPTTQPSPSGRTVKKPTSVRKLQAS